MACKELTTKSVEIIKRKKKTFAAFFVILTFSKFQSEEILSVKANIFAIMSVVLEGRKNVALYYLTLGIIPVSFINIETQQRRGGSHFSDTKSKAVVL